MSATFLFKGVAIDDVVGHASRATFNALEFQVLESGDAPTFAPHIANAGLEVALINCSLGDLLSNGPELSGVPGRESEFKVALDAAFDNAKVLGAKVVHIGPSRVPNAVHRDKCLLQLVRNLNRAVDKFSGLNVMLSLEPLNVRDFPDILVNSPEQALELIDIVDCEKLVLQYDMYHASMDQRAISSDLQSMISRIGHIQFADCPGRHEPGTGNVYFRVHFEELRLLGYRHHVGAEYVPSRPVSQTFDWMNLL